MGVNVFNSVLSRRALVGVLEDSLALHHAALELAPAHVPVGGQGDPFGTPGRLGLGPECGTY